MARDLLKAGMATLMPAADPKAERFMLSDAQVERLKGLYGSEALGARGLL